MRTKAFAKSIVHLSYHTLSQHVITLSHSLVVIYYHSLYRIRNSSLRTYCKDQTTCTPARAAGAFVIERCGGPSREPLAAEPLRKPTALGAVCERTGEPEPRRPKIDETDDVLHLELLNESSPSSDLVRLRNCPLASLDPLLDVRIAPVALAPTFETLR